MSKKRPQMQKRKPPLPTTEKLARALESLNDPALTDMIGLAREGYYDDFKTPLATPLVTLYTDLMAAGHPAMAQRVVDGDFDSSREEAEEWFRREGHKLLPQLPDKTGEHDGKF